MFLECATSGLSLQCKFSRINTMTVKEQTQNTSIHLYNALLPNTKALSPRFLPQNAPEVLLHVYPTPPSTGCLTGSQRELPLFSEISLL